MKEYPPYDIPGRWYKIFIESDGSSSSITTTDIVATIDNDVIAFPKGFHILERVFDVHSDINAGSTTSYYDETLLIETGKQGVTLPSATSFDYMDLYIFGYFN